MRNIFPILIFLLIVTYTQAQSNAVSAGGGANGSGGTVSYSIGQVAYTVNTGTNGSVIQGLQQPFEISVITGVRNLEINLNARVYPNPATNSFILTTGNTELKNLSYVLLDTEGRKIDQNKLINSNTVINTALLKSGVYFLNVYSKQNLVKTFKIEKIK